MKFVRAIGAGQFGKFNAFRLVLMLLRITADAFGPVVVAANFRSPGTRQGVRHGEGAAQRVEIGDGFIRVVNLQIALARDARIAAFFAFRCFFQHQHFRAHVAGGNCGRSTRAAKTDDDNFRFLIPFLR